MGFWPFGRKKKKKPSPVDVPVMGMSEARQIERARRDAGPAVVPMVETKPSRQENQRKRSSSSRKLTKSNHSRPRETEKGESIPPIPTMRYGLSGELTGVNEKNDLPVSSNTPNQQLAQAPIDRGDVPSYYFQNTMSVSSLQVERSSGPPKPPTLLARPGANDASLLRRKSSKRKAEDHAREREIKAMSATVPVPVRPTRFNTNPLVQDSVQPPDSDVSLAVPESMQSSTSAIPEEHGPRLGLFEVLSPRPTIRYSENPRNSRNSTGTNSLGPSRTSTKKEKRPAVSQETVKASKRIDDLADDLDSGTLRELMDRDRRRKENKRILEQDRLQRRLERKAQKQLQKSTMDEDVVGGPSRGRDPEPKPLGTIGLGIGGDATKVEDDAQANEMVMDEPPKSPETWLRDPSKNSKSYMPLDDPFQDPVLDIPASHLEDPTPADEPDEPVIEVATAVRLSAASMSPPTSPIHHIREQSNLSQLSISASRSTPDIPEHVTAERRGSDTGARLGGTWTSFFRRGGTRTRRDSGDRGRATPSGFSNTSRESIARQYPPSAFARSIRARSGTPVRTQSKFREDLPELPISPPDSRVQSPELPIQYRQADPPTSTIPSPIELATNSGQPLSDIHPAFREEVALSRHQSSRSVNSPEPTAALVPQSLASVDSEGSWLTGKPVKRSSNSMGNPLRESASSLQRRLQEFGESEGNVGTTDNEGKALQGPTSDMEDSLATKYPVRKHADPAESDDELDVESPEDVTHGSTQQGKLHSAIGRSPTIVQHAARAKSREGLLEDFLAGDESTESSPAADSPSGPLDYIKARVGNPFIQRATSVELGKGHARHISAGSAKLLDLPRRASGDLKRMSNTSGGPSPLSSPTFMPSKKTEIGD